MCENLFFGLSVFAPRREVHKARIWAELLRPFRVVQSAAPAGGGLQLVGARCCSPLAANYYRAQYEIGRVFATQRVARAGRLPTGGPQHAACASRVAVPPGRPSAQSSAIWGSSSLLPTATPFPVYSERQRN